VNLRGEPAHVGRHCGSSEYDITREIVDFYADALDDHHPLYAEWAPPLLHHSECYRYVGEWYLKNLFGNLHGQQDWELFGPIRIGSDVRTCSTIIDRYSKRGRDWVVNETDVFDAADHRLLRDREPVGQLEQRLGGAGLIRVQDGVAGLLHKVHARRHGAPRRQVVDDRAKWPPRAMRDVLAREGHSDVHPCLGGRARLAPRDDGGDPVRQRDADLGHRASRAWAVWRP